MRRDQALAFLNGRILAAYSRRTLGALQSSAPLRVVMVHIEPVLSLNVEKEVRKDALVIRRAAAALAAGAPPQRDAARQLFEATMAIDRQFVERTAGLPLRIEIPYERVGALRLERIECLLDAAYRVLAAWPPGSGALRATLRRCFPRTALEGLLRRMLGLYALEARVLGDSVRVPALIAPLRSHAAARLYETMSELAQRLAVEISRAVHDPAREAVARNPAPGAAGD